MRIEFQCIDTIIITTSFLLTRLAIAVNTGEVMAVEFYYAANASDPDWIYIGRLLTESGNQDIMLSYTIPSGATTQAVRVQLRYIIWDSKGNPCQSGANRERDDLVFSVYTPITPGIEPIIAHFDDNYGAPRCDFFSSSCDTGLLVDGARARHAHIPQPWMQIAKEIHGSNT